MDENLIGLVKLSDLGKFGRLKNYFKRYNKVLLDTLAIEKEKDIMKKTNKKLKEDLIKYMDGLTVNKYLFENPDNSLMQTHKLPSLSKELPINEIVENNKIYVYNKN